MYKLNYFFQLLRPSYADTQELSDSRRILLFVDLGELRQALALLLVGDVGPLPAVRDADRQIDARPGRLRDVRAFAPGDVQDFLEAVSHGGRGEQR